MSSSRRRATEGASMFVWATSSGKRTATGMISDSTLVVMDAVGVGVGDRLVWIEFGVKC